MEWTDELAYWLDRRGHECAVLAHESRRLRDEEPGAPGHVEWGTLRIDAVDWPFEVERQAYGNAEVRFAGVADACVCPDQQALLLLPDGSCVSDRHPGLRWLHGDAAIDADGMRRLWRAGEAYPFEMPCLDADGNRVVFGDCVTNGVETSAVLEHVYPHVRRVKLGRLRDAIMSRRIQRAWLEASYDPFGTLGQRVLRQRARAVAELIERADAARRAE